MAAKATIVTLATAVTNYGSKVTTVSGNSVTSYGIKVPIVTGVMAITNSVAK
jgi:hypothetical protein